MGSSGVLAFRAYARTYASVRTADSRSLRQFLPGVVRIASSQRACRLKLHIFAPKVLKKSLDFTLIPSLCWRCSDRSKKSQKSVILPCYNGRVSSLNHQKCGFYFLRVADA